MVEANTRVLVIGAGYAGMMVALRLAGKTRNDPVEITLINALDGFVQRPQLIHLLANQKVAQKSIQHMLRGSRVAFHQGWVESIDLKRQYATVITSSGRQEFPYDYLVYCLGSGIDQDSVPGIREYAYFVNPYGKRSVTELRQRLIELSKTSGKVVVVGGGATGIEAATEIKASFANIQVGLVTDGQFGVFRGERVKHHLRQAFLDQGIPFYEGKTVTALEDGKIILAGGEEIAFDACVWAGGFRAAPLAYEAGLSVNHADQVLVDPYGRSISHPKVFAAGDAAYPVEEPGVAIRMSLFVSLTLAAHAADNLSAEIQGRPLRPLSFAYYGQGIMLGPKDAVGLITYPDDVTRGPIFRGKPAVWIREFAVWLAGFLLELERFRPGSYIWLRSPHMGEKSFQAQPRANNLQGPIEGVNQPRR